MNVANASFSQMPFHHRIVTRSPNHMWASSWATTSATFSVRRGCSWPDRASSRLSRKVMHPRFSIAPAAKSGRASRSTLSLGIRDAVVALEPAEGEGADLGGERGEVALAGHVDDAQRHAGRRRSARWPRAGRPRTPRGRCSSASCRRTRTTCLPSPRSTRSTSGPFDTAVSAGSMTRVIAKTALNVGLVPAGERPAAVGRLHLRGGDHLRVAIGIGEGAAIEAAQLVVEHAGEGDLDRRRPGRRARWAW